MGQLAITLEMRGRRCLVVGAGAVAWRKIASLCEAGATVTVVAPDISIELTDEFPIHAHKRMFSPDDIAGTELVFACTDDAGVNAAVAEAATAAGLWVNVADDPAACSFFVNAAVQRGDLTIAVGTQGASPALSRRIRESLEAQFGPAYGPFVALLGQLREEVLLSEPDPERRRAAFARMAAVPCEQIIAERGMSGLEAAVRSAMANTEAAA